MTSDTLKMFELAWISSASQRQDCYQIRYAVFVEEQGVPVELEKDDHDDSDAIHCLGTEDGQPVATARLVPLGDAMKFGRFAVLKGSRGNAYGAAILEKAIHYTKAAGYRRMVLDAQVTAIGFYQRYGFQTVGERFDDAGIEHQRMELPLSGS